MILYVVTETEQKYRASTGWMKVKQNLEVQARDFCLVVHYSQLNRRRIAALSPWAICHSGGATPHHDYDVLTHPGYRWVTRTCGIPQIGFCGGHQIIAAHYGGELGDMRPLRSGEPDLNPEYHPGLFKEWGVFPVRVLVPDPLFKGLPGTLLVQQRHRAEVKSLPSQLGLLASSENCRVQAFVHARKPLYGVQFHPESCPESYPHGPRILRNFFAIARAHQGKKQ
jgi:GMP synthase-like glutamine amidotransferase